MRLVSLVLTYTCGSVLQKVVSGMSRDHVTSLICALALLFPQGQIVKEGQVVCYLEQLGTQQPVEVNVLLADSIGSILYLVSILIFRIVMMFTLQYKHDYCFTTVKIVTLLYKEYKYIEEVASHELGTFTMYYPWSLVLRQPTLLSRMRGCGFQGVM